MTGRRVIRATMKRPTEAAAARIEARIIALRYSRLREDRIEAARLQQEYWDACGLNPEVRAQLEAMQKVKP
jgi:hypothetical protein